ncbi:MAG TPA: ATP-binding protein, partial [Bacteroidia bacterium]|nr:ATP-binding protein [Bacteroidia bacterium]
MAGKAGAQFFSLKKYNAENGAAEGSIIQVQQDRQGAVWWVSDEYFTRYNGIIFETKDFEKLAAAYKYVLPYVDTKGNAWLCLAADNKTEVFLHKNGSWQKITVFVNSNGDAPVSFFATYSNDNPWVFIATRGRILTWYNNNWEELSLDAGEEIMMADAMDEVAYAVTGTSVYRTGPGKSPQKLGLAEASAGIIDVNIYGNLWLNKMEPELWLLTPTMIGYIKSGTLTKVKIFDNKEYNFKKLRYNGASKVYLLTAGNEMWQFDLLNGDLRPLAGLGMNTPETINQIYTDRENNLWLATDDGLIKTAIQSISFVNKQNGIGGLPVQAVAAFGNKIFAAGPKGLNVIEAGKVKEYHPFENAGMINPRQRILQLYSDENGVVWLLSNTQGLWKTTDYRNWEQEGKGIEILTFYISPDKNLYIGNRAGVFELKGDTFNLLAQTPAIAIPQRLCQHNNTLVMLANDGIYRFKDDRWQKLTEAGGKPFESPVYAIHNVYDNLAILGTGAGIYYLKEFDLMRYENDTALGKRPFYALAVDKRGAVWLASDTGVIMLDKKGKPKIFGYRGFNFKDIYANPLVASQDGHVWIAMSTGLMMYNPEYEKLATSKPLVQLVKVESREESLEQVNSSAIFKLGSEDNDITFYFDANSFVDEHKNKLLYKLEGYMREWDEMQHITSNSISFKNLPPGQYVLKMQLVNANGVAGDIISSPPVNINKPFYNQWWFYIAAIIAFFAISFGIFYLYGQKKFEKDLISEVERRSRELRSSEDRFRTLWENTSDALVLYNLQGEIVIYNHTFLQMLGRTDNIAGKRIYELIRFRDTEITQGYFRQQLELQQLKSHFEVGTLVNGQESVLEFSNTYLLLPNEKTWVVLSLIRNVTERKLTEINLIKAKNEAEQASRVKSAFLATMSHEIRTPLNAIIGMSSVMNNTQLSEEQRNYVSAIKTGSDTLLSLVNNILDFSKIEAGMMMIEKTEVIIEDCIIETLEILGSLANEKGVYLYYRIHPDTPVKIVSDKTRLRQVLINLVGNAIKFTEKGFIEIAVKPDDTLNTLKLSVTDSGIGIPRSKINDLFKVFTQVDDSTTRKYGGTGLGLAITDKLINLLGGSIRVASEVGKGSQFIFSIKDFSSGLHPMRRNEIIAKSPELNIGIISPKNEILNIFRIYNEEREIKTHTAASFATAASLVKEASVLFVD